MPFKACCQVSSVRGRGIERNFRNRGIFLARKDRAQLYQVRSNTRHVHMEGSIVNGQGGDGTGSSKLVLTLRNGLGAKRVLNERKGKSACSSTNLPVNPIQTRQRELYLFNVCL